MPRQRRPKPDPAPPPAPAPAPAPAVENLPVGTELRLVRSEGGWVGTLTGPVQAGPGFMGAPVAGPVKEPTAAELVAGLAACFFAGAFNLEPVAHQRGAK